MPAQIWHDLFGQTEAISQLELAVKHRDEGVHHAWLLTGPPGSGRSNMAQAFAAALLCPSGGCGSCRSCVLAKSGNHPDIDILATDKVGISIDEIRALVTNAQLGGSMGRFRIMIIEDADRMAERSSNVLLKALEEPPAGTVWILCAPSEADMLPTIRSRVRRIALKTPSAEEVAALLVERDAVDRSLALKVAAEAQSHIGMARRLATNADARGRRKDTLVAALEVDSVGKAIFTAERWLDLATRDAENLTNDRDAEERKELLRVLGVEDAAKLPPYARADVKALEESQKRRATRSLRDGIDRILVDLLSLYRDILVIQLASGSSLVNEELRQAIQAVAAKSTPAQTLKKLDQIEIARGRIAANVKDQMVLEALAVNLRTRK